MRAGFFTLLVILVGFGFLSSEVYHKSQELSSANDKIWSLEGELQTAKDQNEASLADIENLRTQISKLEEEKKQLETQIENFQLENSLLRGQNIQIQWENNQMATYSPALSYLIKMISTNESRTMATSVLPLAIGVLVIARRKYSRCKITQTHKRMHKERQGKLLI
ncbi:MAG TPA: hypothetical protein PKJ84_00135 [Anaerolineales bacterium]|nr:hypothetical protein [Anaerolineales bacterium]HNO92544.1 hypothetical protein [Anaerolineales bacterium]